MDIGKKNETIKYKWVWAQQIGKYRGTSKI